MSPGSRSTPLVLALASEPEVEIADVLDERAAAFVALGHARRSGRPAIVVATSGTAPAHWYPAAIEAAEARIPLVLLSADRPTELQHRGAPQTIDQVGLFGSRVRFAADLGDPSHEPRWLAGARSTVAHACARSLWPVPGPVHVNFRARKPLEPGPAPDATTLAARAVVDGLLGRGVPRETAPGSVLREDDVVRLAERIGRAERPLVVLGPAPALVDRDPIVRFLSALGAPFHAEATSQLRFGDRPEALAIDSLDLLLASGAGLPEPDLLISIGATPTSGALDRYLAGRPGLARIVLGAPGWTDPWASAEEIVRGEPDAIAGALAPRLRPAPSGWPERLRALDARAWAAVEAELGEPLGEGEVALATVAAVPGGAALLVGNSLPIRTVDRFVRGGGAPRCVLSQRGVNGIDGLVAGAIGAHRADGGPLVALLGDLSTLHDVGALAAAPRSGAPLVLVVVHNGGGRIFEQLPLAARPDLSFAMVHVLGQHGHSLSGIAAAFGHRATTVRSAPELRATLRSALDGEGTTLIEAIVPPHGARDADARLRAALRGAT
jgi:2-succinyl-5-enolpyruvyl-6-hydroxy-3-cyclohexene-1-carboxylate synthase